MMPCPCPTRTALHILEVGHLLLAKPLSLRSSALVCEAVGGKDSERWGDGGPAPFQALVATVCNSPWMCPPPQTHLASPRVI